MSIASGFELDCRASRNVSISERTKGIIWQTSEIEVNVCLDVFRAHFSQDSGTHVSRIFSRALD